MNEGSDLYFILNPSLGIIKIGVSQNIVTRVATLANAAGVPLQVLRLEKGLGTMEAELHAAFDRDRLIGEWFGPSDELLTLATGTESIEAFVTRVRPRIEAFAEKRLADKIALAQENEAERRAQEEEIKRLRAEAKRLAERRMERIAKARATKEANRRAEAERRAAEVLANSTGMILGDAQRVAAERRKAVAQRFRNAAFLGLRGAEVLPVDEGVVQSSATESATTEAVFV